MATFNSTGLTNKPLNSGFSNGKSRLTVQAQHTITAAGTTNGDIFVLAGPLSLDSRLVGLFGITPALTSASNNDLGFYTKDSSGALVEIDKDILWDGITLASATAFRNQLYYFNTSLDLTKTIREHLSLKPDVHYPNGVFLCLTMNTESTATSEVLLLDVEIEQPTC